MHGLVEILGSLFDKDLQGISKEINSWQRIISAEIWNAQQNNYKFFKAEMKLK